MKNRMGLSLSVFLSICVAAVLLFPAASHSFWYGYGEELAAGAPSDPEGIHDALVEGYLPGLAGNLFIHDNVDESEVGQVTIYEKGYHGAWDGYTLLSSFGGLCAAPEVAEGVCPAMVPHPVPGTDPVEMEMVPTSPIGAGLCKVEVPVCLFPLYAKWALLIDMDGKLVKTWPLVGGPAEMLPTGNVRGGHMAPNTAPPANPTGGVGGLPSLVEMNWNEETVWFWNGPVDAEGDQKPGGAIVHHDHQAKDYHVYHAGAGNDLAVDAPTKRTLVLSSHETGTAQDGLGVRCPDTSDISLFPLMEDAIYEINEETGEITFAWYPCEHIDEMGFDAKAREGIMNIASNAQAGLLGFAGPPYDMQTDWTHINSVSYLGPNRWYDEGDQRFHPDNIIFDCRSNNLIGIIARHAGEYNGESWGEGAIVWKVGPQYREGYKEASLGVIIGPHMAHMIPEGLPGAGNILVYDNGGIAGYGSLLPGLPGYYPNTFRSYSRIVEFNPITLEKVWEYKCPEGRNTGPYFERKFYSMLISGAQRTPNGNTVICEGQPGRIFEVTAKGKIVWEYISAFGNGFPLGPAGFLGPRPIYRAQRVPYHWVADDLLRPTERPAPTRSRR